MQEKKTDGASGNGQRDKRNISGYFNTIDDIEAAFQTGENTNVVRYFVEPGEEVQKLLMRANFKDRRIAVAVARHYAKCLKFGDKNGADELLAVIAGECSIDNGRRAEMLLKAVIGQQNIMANKGFMDKFKDAAGLGEQ